MADDIDIEEHDLSDNPCIINIFPDLTRIKPEAPDPDDEDHHMDLEYRDGAETSNTRTSLQVDYHVHNNQIILGSKRVANPAHDQGTTSYSNDHFEFEQQQPFEFDENIEIKLEAEDSSSEEIERHGSYTLGSKPNRPAPEVENHGVYSSVVALEDWGPRLQRSNCYCKDCAILFPTRNCLDAHKMAAHSFLEALSNDSLGNQPGAAKSANKAVKSTTKNIQFSTKSSLSVPSTSKAKFCSHCNETFTSDNALITHLYETLTAKKFPCKLCDRIFNEETELIAHIESRHNEADNDDESFDDGSDKDLFYRCHICSCYFIYNRRLERHMLMNHSLETYPGEKTQFEGICNRCGSKFGSTKTYNSHVFRYHRQKYIQKPGLKCNVPHKFQAVNKSKLNKHPASSKYSYKCTKCGKLFDSYGKAWYHKGRIHANIPNTSILRISVNPQTSSNNLFKCMKCDKSFDSYGKAKYHKKKMHANIPHISILPVNPTHIIKKNLKIKKTEKDQNKCNIFIYKGVVNPPIAKSVLFKCSKCPLHFTNCSDAVFHSYKCNKLGEDWKCPVCSRCFEFDHKAVHERQHQVSDRFVVHLTNDSVYGRTLCQCPECNIYYSEQEFWVHVKQGCGQPKSVPCNECNILIHVSSAKMHKQLHKSQHFTTEQLILIEFISLQDKVADDDENLSVGSKRKIPKDYDASDSKRAKLSIEKEQYERDKKEETVKVKTREIKRVMYHCETCNLFARATRAKSFHLAGKCKSLKHVFRVCKKCGLTTSYNSFKSHNQMHTLGQTIFDFTYVRLQDHKVINPMPNFPKCLDCGVHFLTRSAKHECNFVYKTCRYCKKMFSNAAYRLHIQFHNYATNRKRYKSKGSPAINEIAAKENGSSGKSSPMPELQKKYKQLTKTWNILYLCEVCDIVCDSYDKVVEHSQDHFNNMESLDMSFENCEICDLRFDATCFDEHKDLHDENANLNRQFFNVLRYNYKNLLSDNWFELFRLLPATQMEQIVSQSIYAHDRKMRTIRMRVLQDGPPKNTVYKCGRCHGYLTASMVGVHMKSYICPTHRYKCTMCNLDFKFMKCLKEHQIACQVTNQTYREVLFNDITDSMFRQKLQVTHEANETQTVVAQAGKPKSNGVVYRFYKCDVCGCCSGRGRHAVCVEGVKCPKCDLLFERKQGIFRHRQLHERYPKLSKRTVTITHFTPEAYKNLPKLYRCQCGLHFTSLQTGEKHLTLCEPGYSISKEKCSKCGLLFPTAVLVSHLCSHHSNDKRTEFHIIPMASNKKIRTAKMKKMDGKTKDPVVTENKSGDPRKTVYMCHQCNLCSLAISTLDYHFAHNHKLTIAIEHCDKCGLNFTEKSMKTHVSLHHDLLKCSRSDIKVKVYRQPPFKKLGVCANDNSTKATTSKKKYSRSKEEHFGSYDDDDDDILKDDTKDLSDEDRKYLNRYLYQCYSCDINFLNAASCDTHYRRFHEDRQSSEQMNVSCDICGLSFSPVTLVKHKKIHHKIMKLNRDDFIVIKCGMVCRNLYKCEECDVHFLTHLHYVKHCSKGIHSIRKTACDICGYNFPEYVIKRHTYKHHMVNTLSREDYNVVTNVYDVDGTRFGEEEESQDSLINYGDLEVDDNDESTLVEDETQRQERKIIRSSNKPTTSQESIVTNRLYKCRTCTLHFCKEYSLIEHLADASVSGHNGHGKKCGHCELKFSLEKDLVCHILEQHGKLKLTQKELLIIESDNDDDTNYATKYLYKCAECDTHFLKEATAENHKYLKAKTKCEKCGLFFTSADISDHTKLHHELNDMKFDDYRYIIVGSKCSLTEFQTIPMAPNKKIHTAKMKASKMDATGKTKDPVVAENKRYDPRKTVYMCHQCNLCSMGIPALDYHFAHNHKLTIAIEHCDKCGLNFTEKSMKTHISVHHDLLKCSRSDIKVKVYRESPYAKFRLQKLAAYANHNSTKVTTSKEKFPRSTEEEPFGSCDDDDDILKDDKLPVYDNDNLIKATTSKDKYTRSKEDHLRSYDDDDDILTKDPVVTENKSDDPRKTVYMCHQCNLCSMVIPTLDYHFAQNHKMTIAIENCDKCGLNFTKSSMKTHIKLHHNLLKLSRSDINVKVYKESPYAKYRLQRLAAYANNNSTKVTTSKEKYSRSTEEALGSCDDDDDDDILMDDKLPVYDNDNSIKATTSKDKYTRSKEDHLRSYDDDDDILTKDPVVTENKSDDPRKTVYMCHQCNLCSMAISTLDYHFAHNHKLTIAIEHCDKCGLNFTEKSMKTHISLHHDLLKCSRSDIKVKVYREPPFKKLAVCANDNSTKATTSKKKYSRSKEEHFGSYDDDDDNILKDYTEDISDEERKYLNRYLYQCSSCDMNFLKASSCKTHYKRFHEDCLSSEQMNVSCDICGLNFSSVTLVKHKKIHHKIMKLNRDDFIVIKCGMVCRNLYKCEECDVHFLTHLHYVKHCSKGIHSIRKTACDICGYNFPEYLLKRHTYKHHTVNTLSREDYNVITNVYDVDDKTFGEEEESQDSLINYDDSEVDDNDESTLVEDETQRQERRRIRSSNKPTTSQESVVTNRLYKCRTCTLHFCKEYSLIEHLADASVSGHNGHGKNCGYCELKFSLEKDLFCHLLEQHGKLKLTQKELLIIESDNADDTNYATKYLYTCAECDTHFLKEATAENHKHPKAKTKCEKCGIVFTSADISNHIKLHHELMDMKFDDYSFIIVGCKTCNLSEKYKVSLRNYKPGNSIYPCSKGCGLNYISLSAVLVHKLICTGEVRNTKSKRSRADCEICGLTFSGRTLALHRRLQHDKLKLKLEDFCFRSDYDLETSSVTHSESQSEDFNVKVKSLALSSDTTLKQATPSVANISDIDIDESKTSTEKADESEIGDIDASETSSVQMDLSVDELDSNAGKVKVAESSTTSNKKVVHFKLYKCGDCNVYYLTQTTCYMHMMNHETLDSLEYIECKLCGLQFRIETLRKHMNQHKTNFNLENVLVKEYRTTDGKTPKIDIYYALDKIQSRLVSTTTDSKDVSESNVDSTVKDIVLPVDDQDNTEKEVSNPIIDQTATDITSKDLSGPTATEVPVTDVSYPILTENVVKQVNELAKDGAVSKITPEVDSYPSGEAVSTGTAKDVVDSVARDIKGKDNDPVFEDIVTVYVADVNEPSLSESVTDSTVKQDKNSVATEDNVRNDVENYHDLNRIQTESVVDNKIEVNDVLNSYLSGKAVSTGTAKDVVDSVARNIKGKDNDRVFEDNVTVYVVGVNEPSLSESVTDSTVKQDKNSVATEDNVRNDVENNHDLNRIQTESVVDNKIEVNDVLASPNQEDELTKVNTDKLTESESVHV